jgi:hypothetical protein
VAATPDCKLNRRSYRFSRLARMLSLRQFFEAAVNTAEMGAV